MTMTTAIEKGLCFLQLTIDRGQRGRIVHLLIG
jgi:hypothetical protein